MRTQVQRSAVRFLSGTVRNRVVFKPQPGFRQHNSLWLSPLKINEWKHERMNECMHENYALCWSCTPPGRTSKSYLGAMCTLNKPRTARGDTHLGRRGNVWHGRTQKSGRESGLLLLLGPYLNFWHIQTHFPSPFSFRNQPPGHIPEMPLKPP